MRFRAAASALLGGALLASCALDDDYFLEPSDAGTGGGERGGADAGKARPGGGAGQGVGGSSALAGQVNAPGDCPECEQECTRATLRRKQYAFCAFDATYAQAEARCARERMILAVVASAEDDAWVLATMAGIYSGPQLRAFIGASDAAQEGEWTWANGEVFWRGGIDGEAVSGRYEHWADGQPANFSPVTMTEEDCLTLTFLDGSWNDMRCELPLPFVCAER